MGKIARYALIAIAFASVVAGIDLSVSHFTTGETCPMLGPIPACYIVALGYLAVGISAISGTSRWARSVFFLGWFPIATLALFGIAFELIGQDICPPGAFGVPQCFYSFLVAILCLVLFLVFRKFAHKTIQLEES